MNRRLLIFLFELVSREHRFLYFFFFILESLEPHDWNIRDDAPLLNVIVMKKKKKKKKKNCEICMRCAVHHFRHTVHQHCLFFFTKYSWLSLSRTRLSRMTAYLEMKIRSLPKHESLTTGKKYCGKGEKLLLRSNFSSLPQYFQYISNFKNLFIYIFVKCG